MKSFITGALSLLVAASTLAGFSSANAVVTTAKENGRTDVTGVINSRQEFDNVDLLDLYSDGTLDAGDELLAFLTITSGIDSIIVNATASFDINLDFLVFTGNDATRTLEFELYDNTTNMLIDTVLVPFASGQDSIGTLFAGLSAGSYFLRMDLLTSTARTNFDLSFVASANPIPVPAAALMFVPALAAARSLRRRKAA